jgi:methylmalonyl-CoA mutase
MADLNFKEFSATNEHDWIQKIIKELKGQSIESLNKTNSSGITTKPVYTQNDIQANTGLPGEPPYSRGLKRDNNEWLIAQSFYVDNNEKECNKKILEALEGGVNYLVIEGSPQDFDTLFKDVIWSYIGVRFNQLDNLAVLNKTDALLEKLNYSNQQLNIALNYDVFRDCLNSSEAYHYGFLQNELIESYINNLKTLKGSRYYNVAANELAEAGASVVTELGAAIANAHEKLYLYLGSIGSTIDGFTAKLQFTLGISTDFFTEIAKFRALRILWARIVSEYEPEHACSHATWIDAVSTTRYYSAADANTNMLRGTTMAMSAILGGVNTVLIHPYDFHLKTKSGYGERIARNISHLLKEEAHLDKILDVSGGAYYIETLTNEIADKAWQFFQEIEAEGGFDKYIHNKKLQKRIQKEAQEQESKILSGEKIMIGVNKFPNVKDQTDDWKFDLSDESKAIQNSELIQRRISESIEKQKLTC